MNMYVKTFGWYSLFFSIVCAAIIFWKSEKNTKDVYLKNESLSSVTKKRFTNIDKIGDVKIDIKSQEMEKSISDLTTMVVDLHADINDLKDNSSSHAEEPSSSGIPINTQDEEAQQELMFQKQDLSLNESLISQEVDEVWSNETETLVLEALNNGSENIYASSIVCRSSMCRLNIERPEGKTDEATLAAFEDNISWDGEMTMTYNPNTGKGIVYMAKIGTALPMDVN